MSPNDPIITMRDRRRKPPMRLRVTKKLSGEEAALMTAATPGTQFEIRVDGVVRTHRDVRETAIEAARFRQQRNPGATILITGLREASVDPFDPAANRTA